jgi:hypothetical protein
MPATPERILRTINAFHETAALRAAIELDLFTAIGQGNETVETMARHIQASARGTRILCDYLAMLGFLVKNGGRYTLTEESAVFLDRRSPVYIGDAQRFLASPELLAFFGDAAAVVRKGGTTHGQGSLAPEDPMWVNFARNMAPLMRMPAGELAKLVAAGEPRPMKVLDIAAGHGLFGISVAQLNPRAQVTALDWPAVLGVARENAESAGVADRYTWLPGSAFDVDYGSGYDVVLLTNFLHHFSPAACAGLLRKIRAALKPEGCVATLEFVPNEDRISPPLAAAFSFVMLTTTEEGDAYTFADLDAMFRNAGFTRNELHPVPPGSAIVSRL